MPRRRAVCRPPVGELLALGEVLRPALGQRRGVTAAAGRGGLRGMRRAIWAGPRRLASLRVLIIRPVLGFAPGLRPVLWQRGSRRWRRGGRRRLLPRSRAIRRGEVSGAAVRVDAALPALGECVRARPRPRRAPVSVPKVCTLLRVGPCLRPSRGQRRHLVGASCGCRLGSRRTARGYLPHAGVRRGARCAEGRLRGERGQARHGHAIAGKIVGQRRAHGGRAEGGAAAHRVDDGAAVFAAAGAAAACCSCSYRRLVGGGLLGDAAQGLAPAN